MGSAFGTRSARIGIISTGPINTDRPTTAVDIMGTGRTKIGAWKTSVNPSACVVPTCRFASELDTSPRSLTCNHSLPESSKTRRGKMPDQGPGSSGMQLQPQ